MKDIIKNIDKESTFLLVVLKFGIYALWFFMASLFALLINDNTTKFKLILLLILLFIAFYFRTLLKKKYNNLKNCTYYDLKHKVEMFLFDKIKDIKNEDVYSLDKEKLSKKILQFTYNLTKTYNDTENCFVPLILCFLVMFIVTAKVSVLFTIFLLVLVIIVCIWRYKYIISDDDKTWINYNDLLKDFISKLTTIKKYNLFNYCSKKLKDNKDNDIVVISDDYKDDMIFNNFIYLLLFVIMAFLIIKKDNFTVVGLMIFYVFMIVKLKELLYRLMPAIKNIFDTYSNYDELDHYFSNNIHKDFVSSFKNININNMEYSIKGTDYSLSVSNLDIEKGDSISIMGKPGEGKSIILNVLSGMYKLEKGNIIIDDKNLDGYIDLAHITCNDDIFNLSLRDNLSLGMKISDEALLQYLDEIGLSEWFGMLGNGLDTVLDEKYIEISVKEKIKLCIIRAIVLDKVLYLIDDFGEYLDIESEKLISEMIRKYLKKKTFIIVAHKPIFTTICKKHYFIKNHVLLEKETLL